MFNDTRDDVDLINNILLGDKQSENLFYEKYSKIVRNFIKSKFTNCRDIDDDVSEIMIKIFTKLSQFDESKSKFKTWVYALTKNYMIDKWRNTTTVHSSINTVNIDDNIINFTNNTQSNNLLCSTTNTFELNNSINHIFTQVSVTDYAYLNMKYIEGYDYNEIGREFNVTSSTVSNRVNYLKTKLKKNNLELFYE